MISVKMSAQLKRQSLSLKSMVWMSQRKLSSRQKPDRADHHDIVIAGGGMVGSAAAIALSKLGKAMYSTFKKISFQESNGSDGLIY